MPTYQIVSPDGTTHEVTDAEDYASALSMHSDLTGYSGTKDFFKSIPYGAVHRGIAPILSTTGSLEKAAMSQPEAMPSSEEVASSIEKGVTGPLHKPEGIGGEYGASIGGGIAAAPFSPPMAGGAIRAIAGTVLPALGGETAGQLTKESPSIEPWARAAGSAVSAGVPRTAAKAITPYPTIDPKRMAAAQYLEDLGVPVSAGSKTGNEMLKRREQQLAGFGPQSTNVAPAAYKLAGVPYNPEVTLPANLNDGFRINSDAYKSLTSRNPVLVIDKVAANEATDAVNRYASRLEVGKVPKILKDYSNKVTEWANSGATTGEAYQNLRSQIGAEARANSSNPKLRDALYDVQHSLDDAAERSIAISNPSDLGEWRKTARQYKDLLVLEKAGSRSGEQVASDIITPQNLKASQDAVYGKKDYARGRGTFSDLSRAGQMVLTSKGSSGTAENIAARNLGVGPTSIVGGIVGAGLGGAGGFAVGHPEIGGYLAALGAMAPSAYGHFLASPFGQRFVANQLMTPYQGQIKGIERQALIQSLLRGWQTENQ